jgi:hypothetical protein
MGTLSVLHDPKLTGKWVCTLKHIFIFIISALLLSACASDGNEAFFKPVYFELHPVYPNR